MDIKTQFHLNEENINQMSCNDLMCYAIAYLEKKEKPKSSMEWQVFISRLFSYWEYCLSYEQLHKKIIAINNKKWFEPVLMKIREEAMSQAKYLKNYK
jgi:hypothetical protein